MTKYVYAQVEFVSLHQKAPADFPNLSSSPHLMIGSTTTSISKYALEVGHGDPGEPPLYDTFDFAEFQITKVSFTKPSDYPGRGTYDTENGQSTYTKWRVVEVPDNFVVPPELGAIIAPEVVIDYVFDQLRDLATDRGLSNVLYYLDRVDQILAARSLHDVLAGHMNDQFTLMERAQNGEISPQELLQGSDALGQQFIHDLLVEAGIPSEVVVIFQQIAFTHHESQTGFQLPDGTFFWPWTVIPRDGASYTDYFGYEDTVFVGGALDDVVDLRDGNDIIYGGSGDDTLFAGSGTNTLIGGEDSDRFVHDVRFGGRDAIVDFSQAENDQIFIRGNPAVRSFDAVMSRASQVGANTVINFGNGSTLTLNNVLKDNLTSHDFAFGTFENASPGITAFGSSFKAGGWSNDDTFHRTLADVNGDGRADIIGFGYSSTLVSLSNGAGGFDAPIIGVESFGYSPAGGGWGSNNYTPRTAADVNGDGFADIVGFGYGGTYVSVAIGGGKFSSPILTSNTFGSSAGAGGWSDNNLYHREVADVNGDGMADIVGFGYDGTYVALATGGGNFAAAKLASTTFGASAAAGGWSDDNVYHRELADVNADGMADIVGFGSDTVYVALATGGGNFAAAFPGIAGYGASAAGGSWSNQTTYPRHLADINGDGRAEIVGFGYNGVMVSRAASHLDGTWTFEPALSDLGGFGVSSTAGGWSNNTLYPRLLGDIDGNGTADIVGFGSDGAYVSRSDINWFG